jgi:hypothetical protein
VREDERGKTGEIMVNYEFDEENGSQELRFFFESQEYGMENRLTVVTLGV